LGHYDTIANVYGANRERMNSAAITPMKTMIGLYSVAKRADAIWVLSPYSDRKIRENPDRRAFPDDSSLSSSASF